MKRKGKISRKTKETSISVDLNIDGKGKYKIDTGIGFLNHMLEQLSKHSSIDMSIKAFILMSIEECLDSCSSMWFKKPIPVSILYLPLPSIFKSTLMLVSFVFLLILPLRFIIKNRYTYIIQLWQ